MTDRENPLQPVIDAHAGQMKAVPLAHYEELFAETDPGSMASRSGVSYEGDNDGGIFRFTLLGRNLSVAWPTLDVTYDDTGEKLPHSAQILLADLLLNRRIVPSTGKFVSYKEVPWGDHYYKAFEGRCLKRLAYMFKTSQEFETAAASAGGTHIPEGSGTTYEFDFLNGVLVRLTYWDADEEFPPGSQILFSDNAPLAFTAEDLAVVGDIVLSHLKSHK